MAFCLDFPFKIQVKRRQNLGRFLVTTATINFPDALKKPQVVPTMFSSCFGPVPTRKKLSCTKKRRMSNVQEKKCRGTHSSLSAEAGTHQGVFLPPTNGKPGLHAVAFFFCGFMDMIDFWRQNEFINMCCSNIFVSSA